MASEKFTKADLYTTTYPLTYSSPSQDETHGDIFSICENVDGLQRHLGNRQIQLIAIGGAIGTALFVSIGGALAKGGPLSLLLAYVFYSGVIGLVNNCIAEMSTYMPVSGGFIRLAGKWADPALGFSGGWNFFMYEALCIPFEITALSLVLGFWRDDIPTWTVCLACLVLYTSLNILAVKGYGESEFWLSSGKVILVMLLFCFTFITMVGGNPSHDAYGFRHWRDPGPFAEYLAKGDMGRFEGFLACIWQAGFTIVGPEYISMVAAEAKRPRTYIKNAFKTVYIRFAVFFIGSAFAVGIVCAYNDKTLIAVLSGDTAGAVTAAASPYVIAMQNLGITGLPHLVSALIITSIFSAGNTYFYCASRSLYGLALQGHAPKLFRRCTRRGIPIYCIAVVVIFPLISFLQVSSSTAQVLTWLINLITAGGFINFIHISLTYVYWYRATQVQSFDRSKLPYNGHFQPYSAWISLVFLTTVVFVYGYTSFLPWDVGTFFSYYTLLILSPILFVSWKVVKRTRNVRPEEADLIWEALVIDSYEKTFVSEPVGFWQEIGQLVGWGRREGGNDQRVGRVVRGHV